MEYTMRKIFVMLLMFILCITSFLLYSEEIQSGSNTDILFLTLIIGLSIIVISITVIIIILIRIMRERKKEIMVLKDLDMEERRKHLRDFTPTNIRVKQRFPDGRYKIMTFRNRNISKGGVFIITENLSLFDLGEELEIVIKDGGKNYFVGKAMVIHSEAIFNKDSIKTESGYGVMFLASL